MADQESLQSLFDSAQKKLATKEFPAAKDILVKIKQQGYTSASIEASLGRAYFESGDLGRGIGAWNNAVALDRFNPTYRSDLALAQSKVPAGAGTKPEHPSEIANLISSYARPAEQYFAGSLLILIVLWTYLAGLWEKVGKGSRIIIGLVLLLILASASFSLSSKSLAVVVEKTSLKPAPLESTDGSLELAPGTRVRVLRSSGAFVEVERPNSFRGWVSSQVLSPSPF